MKYIVIFLKQELVFLPNVASALSEKETMF